jgi:SAM-dependent methyltransferase
MIVEARRAQISLKERRHQDKSGRSIVPTAVTTAVLEAGVPRQHLTHAACGMTRERRGMVTAMNGRSAMGFYQEWVVPALIDLSMRNKRLRPYRERVAGAAEGRVLDVGVGSGLNLPFYARNAQEIFGLDPSPLLLTRAQTNAQHFHNPVHLIEGSAERIPLADRSLDTIVMTWTGCSIPEVCTALEEMRRVLKIGGRLLFVEHGRAPEASVARWQDRLDPFWHRLSGGCHLNRKIDDLLSDAGFRIDRLETGYIPGPRLMTFLYEGAATPT